MIPAISGLEKLSFLGNTIDPAAGAANATAGMGGSFGAMVSEAATRTTETLHGAERMSLQALQGEATTREVADMVMTAEQSLQAAIAVRDKIVTAWLDVSRMSI